MNINPLQPGTTPPSASAGPVLTLSPGQAPLPAVAQVLRTMVVSINAGEALLDLGTLGTVRVAALPGMRSGMPLIVNARPTSSGASLQLAAPLPQPVASSPITLQSGQRVTAQVLDQPAPGRVLVQIGQAVVEARSELPLQTGTSVSLQVCQVQPDVVLGKVEDAVTIKVDRQDILQRLPGPIPGPELLGKMVRERLQGPSLGEAVKAILTGSNTPGASPALSALAARLRALLPPGAPPSAEQLQTFVKEGGVQYEANLARHAVSGDADAMTRTAGQDVKGLLLRALAETPEGRVAESLTRHVSAIEAQQSANLLAQVRGDPLVLHVPLLAASGDVSTLHLSVEAELSDGGDSGTQSPAYGLLMHLELESLGEVRIDAHFSATGTSVAFYVDGESATVRLRGELPALREALAPLGGPVSLVVRRVQELPRETKSAFQALIEGVPRSGIGLDLMG